MQTDDTPGESTDTDDPDREESSGPGRLAKHEAELAAQGVTHGLTVLDIANRWRVSPDRVRALIRSGKLKALNTSGSCIRRPRFIVLPVWLEEYERGMQVCTSPKTAPRRRRRPAIHDYYPDS